MTDPLGRKFLDRADRFWLRAPARRDGEDIVIARDRGETYQPFDKPHLPYELAKVYTPADAVRFATDYGLIGFYIDPHGNADRQSFADFQRAADWMRQLLPAVGALTAADGRQSSAKKVRAAALVELRRWALTAPDPQTYLLTSIMGVSPELQEKVSSLAALQLKDFSAVDDEAFLRAVDLWIAAALTNGTRLTPLLLRTPRRGQFRMEYSGGPTLVDMACLHIATSLERRKEIRRCAADDCRHYFPVDDRRQQFCNRTCASRDRKRRTRTTSQHEPASLKRQLRPAQHTKTTPKRRRA